MSYSQKDRRLAVATPLGDDVLLLSAFQGTEDISRLFSFELDMLSENDAADFDLIIGKPATVGITLADGSSRYFNGIIRSLEQGSRDHHLATYRAQMVPWLWFLTQTSDHRIFPPDKTAPEIIQLIFDEANFRDYSLRLLGDFTKREYCVQYGETDFAFVSRLMEAEGIYYFFEHENGKHTLVLANGPGAHKPCPTQSKISYDAMGGGLRGEDTIQSWRISHNVLTGSFGLQDFNFETPSTSLQANLGGRNAYERYEYPGGYLIRGKGESLVKTRLEETETPRIVASGKSNCRVFASGYRFDLEDHYRGDQNQTYLLTQVQHQASQGGDFRSGANDKSFVYTNDFECVPFSNPFRPPRATPRPVIHGTQTAIVVGKPGEEIWTDKYGRVKVQFHWDRYGKSDEKSSCWIRVSQASAGKNWGAISLPRIGQEVVVSFLDGDPDRPLITGRVYNAEQMPPYELPGEQTKSTFKSNSSKGGGGFNELRFEDAKGQEQIFIHAERNKDIRVKKDLTETVEENSNRIVIKDHLEEIRGDKHLAVKGDQNEKVDGTVSLKTGMDYQAIVGMKYGLEASTEIHEKAGMNFVLESGATLTLKVGGSFINLNPAGVFISGPMVMMNSGGGAGTGSGASPDSPKMPIEAVQALYGAMTVPNPSKPPKPAIYSPAAVVLQRAAQAGTPFCAVCARAAAAQGKS